ncbi:uncharacterized protein [Anabrus simplex]|uniref:uncharacterized protein n=1 Tax=Anabrus simplex TaxID=316456 RepID=UPI0035A29AF2
MWSGCGCVLAVLLLSELGEASSESHAGLSTTFGQNNKQNQPNNNNNNNNHQQARGKTCTMEANCTAYINTSCVKDLHDGKMRCLCGDRKPPNNGACKNTHMAPGFKCTMDSHCVENAECVDPLAMNPNMTMLSTTMAPSAYKICQCQPGFEEDDTKLHCSNGADNALLSTVLLLVSVYVQVWIL